jgi:hypothetical protein
MNLENLNLVELDAQEHQSTEGGKNIIITNAAVLGFYDDSMLSTIDL